MKSLIYGLAMWLCVAGAAVRAEEKKTEEKKANSPSYTKDVKPFLAKYCVECHNAKVSKSGFNFEGFDALSKGGRKGPAVVAGEPDKSAIVRALGGRGKRMPPTKYKNQPKAEEVDVLKAWIAAGAKDDTEKTDGDKMGSGATSSALSDLVQVALSLLDSLRPEESTVTFHHD